MADLPRVFVSRLIPEAGLRLLRAACAVEVWTEPLPPSPAYLREMARTCVGLVTLLTDRVDAELLAAGPGLKVVSNFAVGYNNIDVAAATARNIRVGNTPDTLTDATADFALTLLLAASRRLVEGVDDAKAGKWQTWEPRGYLGSDLVGQTLGIVGMGRIGYALARRCQRAFDMRVLYTGNRNHEIADRELGAQRVDLPTLLRQADFVSVHAALNEHTKGMFGADQFALMKPSAVLVNTARGPHVDQDALYEALARRQIFAAGLDVTDPEPLPATHKLYTLPNCVIAPHIASATHATRDAMATLCARNAIAGVRGEPLPACVN
jgi:glyoxylate reductase